MNHRFKIGITALIATVLVTFGAFGLGSVSADLDWDDSGNKDVFRVFEHVINPPSGETTASEDCTDTPGEIRLTPFSAPSTLGSLIVLRTATTASTDDEMFLCVNSDDNSSGTKITFDSDDVGKFDQPSCGAEGDNDDGDVAVAEWDDDRCLGTTGSGTDSLSIEEDINGEENDLDVIIVHYTCGSTAGKTTLTITFSNEDQGDPDDIFTATIHCRGTVSALTLTATPNLLEIVPAPGSVSHSFIDLTATDSSGGPVFPGNNEVVFTTDRCSIEEEAVDTEAEYESQKPVYDAYNASKTFGNAIAVEASTSAGFHPWVPPFSPIDTTRQEDVSALYDVTNDPTPITGNHTTLTTSSHAAAILHCSPEAAPGVTPGIATITAVVAIAGAADRTATVTVTVVGPPAFVTVSASPTSLRCGEKSQITVVVRDAIQQNVSDHTLVEMVTNLGGVLGGTGAVVGFAGPVVPISSTVAETFGGIATAFLLTSESHSGPYEVVVATGGGGFVSGTLLGGVFSTPPIVAQVTVTCTLGAPAAAATPTITAPRTGTGITPPNTGDAGLTSSTSSSWILYALAGTALAFALAGLAAAKASRR